MFSDQEQAFWRRYYTMLLEITEKAYGPDLIADLGLDKGLRYSFHQTIFSQKEEISREKESSSLEIGIL